MVNVCCVPECKGNYRSGKKVRVFSFPTNETQFRKWLEAVGRSNFSPTKNNKVCEDHFLKNDFEYNEHRWDNKNQKLLVNSFGNIPRLKKDAVPSVFPTHVIYLPEHSTLVGNDEEINNHLDIEPQQVLEARGGYVKAVGKENRKFAESSTTEKSECFEDKSIRHTLASRKLVPEPFPEVIAPQRTKDIVANDGSKQNVNLKLVCEYKNDSWLAELRSTNELTKDARNIVTDVRVLRTQNAIKNIVIELDRIIHKHPNTERAQKLKSDVVAIIVCYLNDVETYSDYEEDDKTNNIVKEEIPDIDELDSSELEWNLNEFDNRLILNTECNLEKNDCEAGVDSHDSNEIVQLNYASEPEPQIELDNRMILNTECNLEKNDCEAVVDSHDSNEIVQLNYASEPEPQIENINITKTGKRVVRHTCGGCDLSLSSAYFLSHHQKLCVNRYSNDSSLSYWGRKECPKCFKKFTTNGHLRWHLINHKLHDYVTLLDGILSKESQQEEEATEDNSMNNATFVSTENIISNNEDNATNDTLEKISSDKNKIDFKDIGIDSDMFNKIFDSSKPDSEFHVTFIVKCAIRFKPGTKVSDECIENPEEGLCIFCDEKFNSVDELNQHKNSEHHRQGRSYVCNHCPGSFQNMEYLKTHMRKHHKNVTTADGRNKFLENRKRYLKLLYLDAFECPHCTKIFFRMSCLKMHEETHNLHDKTIVRRKAMISQTEYKPTQCPKCPKMLKNKFYMKAHLKNMHGQTVVCEICGAVYNCQMSFKRHMLVHYNVRNTKCDLCPKTFLMRSDMIKHRNRHTKEKQWVCQLCNKHFTENCYLKQHINVHLGLKPFKCPICGIAYTGQKLLKGHLRNSRCRHKIIVKRKE